MKNTILLVVIIGVIIFTVESTVVYILSIYSLHVSIPVTIVCTVYYGIFYLRNFMQETVLMQEISCTNYFHSKLL